MRNSNRPSGPGTPPKQQRDNVTEREELDELAGDGSTAPQAGGDDRRARQAERDAHTASGGRDAGSDSGRRDELGNSARNRGSR